jgi:ABC-type multidrug transport system fused ATPase/permease subunit
VWTDHNAEVYGNSISIYSSSNTPSPGTLLPSVWSSWYIPSKSPIKIQSLLSSKNNEDANTIFYLSIYACFGLGVILAGTVQDVIVLLGALWASRKLHRELLDAVLFSPLRFFETTPVGRILNRFSKDIENIDSNVINTIHYFIYSIIRSVTVVAVIGTIAPPFLLIVPVIGVMYLYVAQLYLSTSRELKRLEAISRSPIYSQFSETLAGVSTIRAYEAEPRFTNENLKKIDENHKPFFYMWAANRWLCLRTDLLSAVVVLFAGLNVVVGGVGAGWAALTITYALDFTDALLWTVRMHAEMEMAMNSVERVEEYTAIEQEPPAIIEENRPSLEWPQEGVIEVKGLCMRYAPDLPDVLKNISFSVQAHEKVAVVGRTGAGKSTLSLAFFRIIPLSAGSIFIDGHDISTVGLYDLRR